jgi:16S rRNA processing protein RimM
MADTAKTLVIVGKITGVHGVKGQVKVKSFTGDPHAIGDYGPLAAGDDGPMLEIVHMQPHKDVFLVQFAGIDGREEAESLKGLELSVPRDVLPKAREGEFYFSDLAGLAVRDKAGKSVGRVLEVVNFGGGDLLDIAFEGHAKSEFLPFNEATVPVVDLAGGFLVVDPPDWMFEGDDSKGDDK